MELRDAEQLAKRLMAEHGLTAKGWTFRWDNAERRFGCCHHGVAFTRIGNYPVQKHDPFISMSRSLTLLNEAAKVEDTIRHEIAHALCKPQKGIHHGDDWKRMCAVTGAKPVRCFLASDTVRVEQDWSAKCGGCGTIYYRAKQPKAYHTFSCPECKRKPFRPYGEKFPLVFVNKHTGRRHDEVERFNSRGITDAVAIPDPLKRTAAIEAMKKYILIERIKELEEKKNA
jgi:predicted SprT family Zn-dependent metalloprotease